MSLSEWLESEDFYNAMQRYRIVPMSDQREVIANFDNVKRMIREKHSGVEQQRDELLAALESLMDMDVSYGRGEKVQRAVMNAQEVITRVKGAAA